VKFEICIELERIKSQTPSQLGLVCSVRTVSALCDMKFILKLFAVFASPILRVESEME